jgi:hypothetical protein
MVASMMLIPASNAFDPNSEIPTFASILAVPNPIGLTQYTHIFMWIDKVFDSAAFVNDYRQHNYKLTIIDPDNETEVHEWETVWDTTSSQGFNFAPSKVGTYTLKFEYPELAIKDYSHNPSSAYENYTYLASSAETTLIVQEEPVTDYPGSYPLPQEYWTRPIYGENPGWYSISSDWLGTGSEQVSQYDRYIADGVGPRTSHIMWTKPLQMGGVVGGDSFEIQGDTYFEGSAYISRYRNPIIVYGRLYYKEPFGFSSGSGGPTVCVDLRTGEEIWRRDDVPSLSFAFIYATHQPNQHGVMQAVLCTSNFRNAFDPDTGNSVFNMSNVPSGTSALGPQGEVIRYVMTNLGTSANPNWYLAQWNSSKTFYVSGLTPRVSGEIDAGDPSNYDWNVSIPWRNTMSSVSVIDGWFNDIMLCREGTAPGYGIWGRPPYAGDPYSYFAVNLNPDKGAIGALLWQETCDAPTSGVTIMSGVADPYSRVFTESYKETMQWVGYSMDTGKKLWGPSEPQAALDYYGYFFPQLLGVPAYGRLYCSGMAGILYCYNITTGDVLWTYGNGGEGNSTNSGFQVPGPYPTFVWAVADGIVYTMTTEHTIQTPIYKGALVRAINATDGTEVWTISNYNGGGTSACALAEGYANFFNGYDNQIYVVGRGPSATTVSAGPKVSALGSQVIVEGMVTDTSAGTQQDEQAARFPNGVPVVSDADMTDWMGYIYQQKPLPTEATGVEVIISVLDPNNNCYEVGRTTSDTSGFFSCDFIPEVPGKYTVVATFAGSEGYWPSHAETALIVEEEPTPTPMPTAEPAPMTDTYVLGFGLASVIAIVVIGLVLIMMLRKR